MIYWTCIILSLALVPPEMCLLGCVFYITDYVKIVGQSEIDKWKKVSPATFFDIRSAIRTLLITHFFKLLQMYLHFSLCYVMNLQNDVNRHVHLVGFFFLIKIVYILTGYRTTRGTGGQRLLQSGHSPVVCHPAHWCLPHSMWNIDIHKKF